MTFIVLGSKCCGFAAFGFPCDGWKRAGAREHQPSFEPLQDTTLRTSPASLSAGQLVPPNLKSFRLYGLWLETVSIVLSGAWRTAHRITPGGDLPSRQGAP